MINGQLALRQKSKSIVNFEVLNFQFALILARDWAGAKARHRQSPPGGKSCRGHLKDEDDSQGRGRPLPCPLYSNPRLRKKQNNFSTK